MGQRLVVRRKRASGSPRGAAVSDQPASLSIFVTELGWLGLAGRDETVMRLFLGHASAEEVRSAAAESIKSPGAALIPQSDWYPRLRRALEDFARGIPTDFANVRVDLGQATPFRIRVLGLARQIGYGCTISYGELAGRAGNREAARAIGGVMASNPIPIIIPCHRVVASGGSIGGFTARQGVALKRRLLQLEAAAGERAV